MQHLANNFLSLHSAFSGVIRGCVSNISVLNLRLTLLIGIILISLIIIG